MRYKRQILISCGALLCIFCFGKVIDSTLLHNTIPKEIKSQINGVAKVFKAKTPNEEFVETLLPESQDSDYVAITSSFVMNPLDRDSSYKVIAYAKILNNGTPANVGDIIIGNDTLRADNTNSYEFAFPLNQGKALHGDSIEVSVPQPTARTLGRTFILVPKEFYPTSMALPKMTVDRANSYSLNWQPDPNNQYGLVQIQVAYNKALSQYYHPGMPNSVDDLIYQVTDNGSYSIPNSDLTRFPKDAYVSISIVRAWKKSQSGNIIYVALAEAKTPPLLVVECPTNLSIAGDNTVCTTSNNYSISNLPTGATVYWQATPASGIVTINSPTAQQTTLTKSSTGIITLTATISNACIGNTITITKPNITVGSPAGIGIVSYNNLGSCDAEGYFQVLGSNPPGYYQYSGTLTVAELSGIVPNVTWSLAPYSTSTYWFWSASGSTVTLSSHRYNANITLRATATNGCGTVYKDYYFNTGDCPLVSVIGGGDNSRTNSSLTPNPTTGLFTATLQTKDAAACIREIIVKNKSGVEVKHLKFAGNSKTQNINIQSLPTDVYVVQIFDGKQWTSSKILKN